MNAHVRAQVAPGVKSSSAKRALESPRYNIAFDALVAEFVNRIGDSWLRFFVFFFGSSSLSPCKVVYGCNSRYPEKLHVRATVPNQQLLIGRDVLDSAVVNVTSILKYVQVLLLFVSGTVNKTHPIAWIFVFSVEKVADCSVFVENLPHETVINIRAQFFNFIKLWLPGETSRH